jgi:radical SAM-linked protein
MRGCPVGCRFCQAGYLYRPTREREPRAVLEGVGRSLEATGYEGFSLTSLNTGEYGDVENLITRLMDTYEDESTSVSLSSLHASTLTASLAEQIKRVRKSGFTIAPEAGSQRMRDVINKNLSEAQILEATGHAFEAGWQLVKLYFMIGLPLEREEDVEAIVELAVRILEQGRAAAGRRVKVTLSASNFIPKPFTPFQWFPMERVERFREKQARLRSRLPRGVSFKYHHFESSYLEGVFSRGDRRLGAALEAAYRRGCVFDGWTEHLDAEAWREAFREAGVDPDAYAYREIPLESELPWEVLDSQINRRWLRREYKRSLEADTLSICGPEDCHGCAPFALDCVQGVVAETTGRTLPAHPAAAVTGASPPATPAPPPGRAGRAAKSAAEEPAPADPPPAPVYRYRGRFEKTGRMRFLGHLDLMRLLIRAFRRAKIRLVHSQGFHPKPKLAFGPALGVGIESRAEHLDFEARDYLEAERFLTAMNGVLPEGLRFRALAPIGQRTPGLQESIRLTRYSASRGVLAREEALRRIESFRGRDRHSVRRERKGKIQEVDIVPLVEEIEVDNGEIRLVIRTTEGPGVRPLEVLEAVFGAEAAAGMSLRREEMLVEHRGRLLNPLVAGRATGRHGDRDHS